MARRGSRAGIEYDDSEVQAALKRVLDGTEDLRPAWPLYHEAFMSAQRSFFDSEGDGRWARLKRRYERWKQRKYPGRRILEMTGALKASLTQPGGYHIFESTQRYMRTGTKDPVANIHFSKKNRGKRKPIDAKSPDIQQHMRDAVNEHLRMVADQWSGGTP